MRAPDENFFIILNILRNLTLTVAIMDNNVIKSDFENIGKMLEILKWDFGVFEKFP